jgi:hypothetical protein
MNRRNQACRAAIGAEKLVQLYLDDRFLRPAHHRDGSRISSGYEAAASGGKDVRRRKILVVDHESLDIGWQSIRPCGLQRFESG